MSNISPSDLSSKSLSPKLKNKYFEYDDQLLSRYQKEFSVREAKRLIDSVEYLGDFKLKSKHAFLLRILLDRYQYGLPVLDKRQKNCFPSMRLIKIAMKYVADHKNTTPDVARRDLENNGFLEVTRNLREHSNQNANNLFCITEKFFLYYALFRIKHEKNILKGSEHEQGKCFKQLEKTELLIKVKIEKINLEKPQLEPVEKMLGTLGSLKKKLKALNEDISEKAIAGKTVPQKSIVFKRDLELNIKNLLDKLGDTKKHKSSKHIKTLKIKPSSGQGDVNTQPSNNKNKQPIPLEIKNPYPLSNTTQTYHNYNYSYLTSNPPPPTPPPQIKTPSLQEEGKLKKIIKLFEAKKGIKQGKRQREAFINKLSENSVSLDQALKNMKFLLQDRVGFHTTGSICRAASPAASIRKGIEIETKEILSCAKKGRLADYPAFAGYFAREAEAVAVFFPDDIKQMANRIDSDCEQETVINFITSLDDEDFFASDNHQQLFETWLNSKSSKLKTSSQHRRSKRCLNDILAIMKQSMQGVVHRYDPNLAKQAAEQHLEEYMQDEERGEMFARFWYETWIKEHRTNIFAAWTQEEQDDPTRPQRTSKLKNYLRDTTGNNFGGQNV